MSDDLPSVGKLASVLISMDLADKKADEAAREAIEKSEEEVGGGSVTQLLTLDGGIEKLGLFEGGDEADEAEEGDGTFDFDSYIEANQEGGRGLFG